MDEEIILTREVLEELKDTIKFRTKVMSHLKMLNGVPDKVLKLETKVGLLLWGVPIILTACGIAIVIMRH